MATETSIHDPTTHPLRLQTLFLPTDDLEVKLSLTGDWAEGLPTASHGGFTPFFERINSHDVRDEDDTEGWTAALEVTTALSEQWELTSVTSWNGLDHRQLFDGDGAPTDGGAIDFYRDESVFTQELRANFASDHWQGVVGLFAQVGHYDSGFDYRFTGLGVGFVKSLEDDRESIALFGSAEHDLTDRLTLGAGLRLNHESYEVVMGQMLSPLGGPDGSDRISQSDTDLLPSASISYQPSDPIQVGLLVSRGYRSGGGSVTYSPQFAGAEVLAYDAEYAWNYEAFWRSRWFDDRLALDGNVFFLDWKDMPSRAAAIRSPVYPIPLLLALVTGVGLVAALVGDGFWDGMSWLLLGIIVLVPLAMVRGPMRRWPRLRDDGIRRGRIP